MQSLMNNPRALQAMMQVQAGLAQLQLEAPSMSQGYESTADHIAVVLASCQPHGVNELAVGFV